MKDDSLEFYMKDDSLEFYMKDDSLELYMKDDCLEFKRLTTLRIYYQLLRRLDFKESAFIPGGKSRLSPPTMKVSNNQACLLDWMRLASSKTGSLEKRARSVLSRRDACYPVSPPYARTYSILNHLSCKLQTAAKFEAGFCFKKSALIPGGESSLSIMFKNLALTLDHIDPYIALPVAKSISCEFR